MTDGDGAGCVQPTADDEYMRANRSRLLALLEKIPVLACPPGWQRVGQFAVGGLTEIGFSATSERMLVISSQGRGVFDCLTGTKVARDFAQDGAWLDYRGMCCEGIGPLQGQSLQIAGLHGGGLPTTTLRGESLEVVFPDWPVSDLIFCANHGVALIEGHQSGCVRIASDFIRAFGFSWSGNSFAYATGSDVSLFVRS